MFANCTVAGTITAQDTPCSRTLARLRRDRLRVPGHGERGMRGTHRPLICLLLAPTDSAIIPASEQAYASLDTKRLSPQDRGTSLPGF